MALSCRLTRRASQCDLEDRVGLFCGRTRPATAVITRFIAEHQGRREDPDGLRWGVESICAQLSGLGVPIAPSTYYEQLSRQPCRRNLREESSRSTSAGIVDKKKVHRLWAEEECSAGCTAGANAPDRRRTRRCARMPPRWCGRWTSSSDPCIARPCHA